MTVKVTFEYGQQDRWTREFSFPGQNAIQLTYNELRIAPSGESVAILSNILWIPISLEHAKLAGLPADEEKEWQAIVEKGFSDVIAWVEP